MLPGAMLPGSRSHAAREKQTERQKSTVPCDVALRNAHDLRERRLNLRSGSQSPLLNPRSGSPEPAVRDSKAHGPSLMSEPHVRASYPGIMPVTDVGETAQY